MGNKQPLFDLRHKRWKSIWHSSKKEYAKNVLADHIIRKGLEEKPKKVSLKISDIYIFGSFRDNVAPRVEIHTSKPGAVLGKSGANIASIKTDMAENLKKENFDSQLIEKMEVSTSLVKNQSADARTIALEIVDGLQKRKSYLYLMRTYADEAIRSGALGVRMSCSGRLNGAEIARTVNLNRGRCPKNTIRESIFYASETAYTDSGTCGVKVWINLPKEQFRKKINRSRPDNDRFGKTRSDFRKPDFNRSDRPESTKKITSEEGKGVVNG